jgi:hypothetical protein
LTLGRADIASTSVVDAYALLEALIEITFLFDFVSDYFKMTTFTGSLGNIGLGSALWSSLDSGDDDNQS